ncbi:uncharacterized protein MKK02DRAFT_30909 [Dioszegia hungarica]|uniref:Uncharacterized protein n=1 Tax=Dioszegia hungarica TaxID=4972 RepID=A0AA38LRV2_9TREE|nr:uncharacterized protein MKK02DRAFT_30909 [Dioszegia hungarica]KAI9631934.1 hypothetical protein MKK02DRAFT_30909 [Dioszegia hungarica]
MPEAAQVLAAILLSMLLQRVLRRLPPPALSSPRVVCPEHHTVDCPARRCTARSWCEGVLDRLTTCSGWRRRVRSPGACATAYGSKGYGRTGGAYGSEVAHVERNEREAVGLVGHGTAEAFGSALTMQRGDDENVMTRLRNAGVLWGNGPLHSSLHHAAGSN